MNQTPAQSSSDAIFHEQMEMLIDDYTKYERGDKSMPFVTLRDSIVSTLNAYTAAREIAAQGVEGGDWKLDVQVINAVESVPLKYFNDDSHGRSANRTGAALIAAAMFKSYPEAKPKFDAVKCVEEAQRVVARGYEAQRPKVIADNTIYNHSERCPECNPNGGSFVRPDFRCEQHKTASPPHVTDALDGERDSDDPHEFGAGIEPNPKASYWYRRSVFWRGWAMQLGYVPTSEREENISDSIDPSHSANVDTLLRFLRNVEPHGNSDAVVLDSLIEFVEGMTANSPLDGERYAVDLFSGIYPPHPSLSDNTGWATGLVLYIDNPKDGGPVTRQGAYDYARRTFIDSTTATPIEPNYWQVRPRFAAIADQADAGVKP